MEIGGKNHFPLCRANPTVSLWSGAPRTHSMIWLPPPGIQESLVAAALQRLIVRRGLGEDHVMPRFAATLLQASCRSMLAVGFGELLSIPSRASALQPKAVQRALY